MQYLANMAPPAPGGAAAKGGAKGGAGGAGGGGESKGDDGSKKNPSGRRGSLGSASNPFEVTGGKDSVRDKLLECNPILEAFGNAKTLRNDNSSRFGKYLRIRFDNKGRITTGAVTHYLLEKSRVISQSKGERNFHFFYQLLAGATPQQKTALELESGPSYHILADSKSTEIVGRMSKNDQDDFGVVIASMATCGFTTDVVDNMLRVVHAVLCLGNVRYDGDANETKGMKAGSNVYMEKAARMLNADPTQLFKALTQKVIKQHDEDIVSFLGIQVAEHNTMSLVKSLYDTLFTFIVTTIGADIAAFAGKGVEDGESYIGILDIFGFEVFEVNGFEQICINFANEKLQQFYTHFVFDIEREIYREEGINFASVNFEDNKAIINMIAKPTTGIFHLLADCCMFADPSSTGMDQKFLGKITQVHKRTKEFGKPDFKKRDSFTVKHSAADVCYSVGGFVLKNKDRLETAVEKSMQDAKLPLLEKMYPKEEEQKTGDGRSSGRSQKRNTFTGSNAMLSLKFTDNINKLVRALERTEPHFVRCLKPNNQKKPLYFDPAVTYNQLQYLGVLDSIKIRHRGFSYRTSYEDFYERFVIIVPTDQHPNLVIDPPPGSDMQALCKELVKVLWDMAVFKNMKIEDQIQFGNTRIFLRRTMIQNLTALREVALQELDRAALVIQGFFRMQQEHLRLHTLRKGIRRLQASFRGRKDRRRWFGRKIAVDKIQFSAKGYLTRKWYLKLKEKNLVLQSFFRRFMQRLRWLKLRRGLRVLHSLTRGFIVRRHVLKMLTAVRTLQNASRGFLRRNGSYWGKVRAALLFQAAWRGYTTRMEREDIVDYLALKREERNKEAAVFKLQSVWKATLVQRRFWQIDQSTRVLQQWVRSIHLRSRFLMVRKAAYKLLRLSRGMLGRKKVREMITVNMVADELWRLKTVREREALQLAKMHSGAQLAQTQFGTTSKLSTVARKTAAFQYKVIDVDTMVDSSDVFPSGWTCLISDLDQQLARHNKRIEHIAVGSTHCVLLDSAGEVHSWGWGDRGQLGHGTFSNESRPRVLETLHFRGASGDKHGKIPRDLAERVIIKGLASGEDHTMALSDQGRVYTWGAGAHGCLGHGEVKNLCSPRPVDGLKRRVAEIACGAHHSVALVVAGSVYTWGSGKQLGLGVFSGSGDQSEPCCVKGLTKFRVRHVNCGHSYTMATTHSGDIYSWGAGNWGQLGHGDLHDRFIPTVIKGLRNSSGNAGGNKSHHARIAGVACGVRHVAAMTSTGRLYTWGWNKHGQLGHGDTEDRTAPEMVQRLKLRRVAEVACGWRHTICLTDESELYTWGHVGCVRKKRSQLHDPDVDSTQFETHIPLEVPFNLSAGRTPRGLDVTFGRMLSITGIKYHQRPVDPEIAALPLMVENSAVLAEADALAEEYHAITPMRHPDDMLQQSSLDEFTEAGEDGLAVIGPKDLAKMDERQLRELIKEMQRCGTVATGSSASMSLGTMHTGGHSASGRSHVQGHGLRRKSNVVLRMSPNGAARSNAGAPMSPTREGGQMVSGQIGGQMVPQPSPIAAPYGRPARMYAGGDQDEHGNIEYGLSSSAGGLTRGESMTKFLHRGKGNTTVKVAQERAWNGNFTSRRARPDESKRGGKRRFSFESRLRTDQLKQHSQITAGEGETKGEDGSSSPPPPPRDELEMPEDPVERERLMIEQMKMDEDRHRSHKMKLWRLHREGAVNNEAILDLFSPDLLVSTSNDELTVADVRNRRLGREPEVPQNADPNWVRQRQEKRQNGHDQGLTVRGMITRTTPPSQRNRVYTVGVKGGKGGKGAGPAGGRGNVGGPRGRGGPGPSRLGQSGGGRGMGSPEPDESSQHGRHVDMFREQQLRDSMPKYTQEAAPIGIREGGGKEGWSGRRMSAQGDIRRQIERDILDSNGGGGGGAQQGGKLPGRNNVLMTGGGGSGGMMQAPPQAGRSAAGAPPQQGGGGSWGQQTRGTTRGGNVPPGPPPGPPSQPPPQQQQQGPPAPYSEVALESEVGELGRQYEELRQRNDMQARQQQEQERRYSSRSQGPAPGPPPGPPPMGSVAMDDDEANRDDFEFPSSITSMIDRIKSKATEDVARLWDAPGVDAPNLQTQYEDVGPPPGPPPAAAQGGGGGRGGKGGKGGGGGRNASIGGNDLLAFVREYHKDGSNQVEMPSMSRLIARSSSTVSKGDLPPGPPPGPPPRNPASVPLPGGRGSRGGSGY